MLIGLCLLSNRLIGGDTDTLTHDGITFLRHEIPVYSFTKLNLQQVFHMNYADYIMAPAEIQRWQKIAAKVEVYEIDLVFTLYPKDINKWRTDYHELLSDRLNMLFQLDTSFRSSNVKWNMILQTDCETEIQAKDFFHGFVVKFRPRKVKIIDEVKSPKHLRALIRGVAATRDSTVFKVLERNPEWDNMLVVADWTGSMYQYGAQLVQWHNKRLSTQTSRVKHLVIFNDGNDTKTAQKRIGKTGGVYYCKSTEIEDILSTMEMVMSRGNGGDSPENDIEAIITGLKYLKGHDEVVLIADNDSDVRDLSLMRSLDVPVRIILCGKKRKEIHDDYLRLAQQTGGSLHTLKRDIEDLGPLINARKPVNTPN